MNRLASTMAWLAVASLALLASPGCISVLNAGQQDSASSTGRGGTGVGSNGGTSAGSTGGTTGGCQANGTECSASDKCCSGSCDETCRQGFGDQCLGDNDCSSLNCVNDHCACSGANRPGGFCATDQDCCWDGGCSLTVSQGVQSGVCCRSVGESCGGTLDCCDQNCVDGECKCLPGGAFGSFDECCSGVSENDMCKNAIGQQCTDFKDCASANCDGGVCGCGISYNDFASSEDGPIDGLCSSDSDCCPDFQCAANLNLMNGIQAIDAGSLCCGATGSSCDQGGGGQGTICCGYCDLGTCKCGSPGPNTGCNTTEGCCPGGVCMPTDGNTLACCQLTGQPCFQQDECCTGFCNANNTCACEPPGGKCGAVATVAPLGPAACCSGVCSDAGACL